MFPLNKSAYMFHINTVKKKYLSKSKITHQKVSIYNFKTVFSLWFAICHNSNLPKFFFFTYGFISQLAH